MRLPFPSLLALVLAVGLGVGPAPVARAQSAGTAPAQAGIAKQLFALDLLIAASNRTPLARGAELAQIAANGMRVAARPGPLSTEQAALLWHAAAKIDEGTAQAAWRLFVRTDVVTTEAHALMLSMVGPPPEFAVQPPLRGLQPRQAQFARTAPTLSRLLAHAWQQGRGELVWEQLSTATQKAQPSAATLAGYERQLGRTFAGQSAHLPATQVLVAPLMAEDTGATLMLGSEQAVLLLGPCRSDKERDTLALHEMLHPRIAALVQQSPALQSAIEHSACLRQAMAGADQTSVSQVYENWADFVAESWVRGLSHELTHTPQEDDGFPLATALAALSQGGGSASGLAQRAAALLQREEAKWCPLATHALASRR